MKLKLFITHAIIFSIGASVASSYFLFKDIPLTANYITADPQYIKLTDEAQPEHYGELLRQNYLGNMYLTKPIYFFKRQNGYNILADLANKGYSPAAFSLFNFEIRKYHQDLLQKSAEAKDHYNKAYKWAMVAAKQGYYFPLQSMVKIYQLENTKDISEELSLLKSWAHKSSIDATAFALHEYYYKKGNEEEAQKWLDTAQKIWDEHRPKPACTTITPWRGW